MLTGFEEGLQWLKESFEEAAEDADGPTSEEVDGVPLVPVGEGADLAMESPIFQRLLQALGIVPPFDEQVKIFFWNFGILNVVECFLV